MKVFFGGHTVTTGKVISDIGRVSIVVFTGLSSQALKDWYIMMPAPAKPDKTPRIQNSLTYFPVVDM